MKFEATHCIGHTEVYSYDWEIQCPKCNHITEFTPKEIIEEGSVMCKGYVIKPSRRFPGGKTCLAFFQLIK